MAEPPESETHTTPEELAGVVMAIVAGVCVIVVLEIGVRLTRKVGGRVAYRHPLLTELMALARGR